MVLLPKLASFAKAYPEVVLDVVTSNEPTDVIAGQFDAGIHIGEYIQRDIIHALRVKTFVGTSANALKIQIWSALIAMLLIKYLQRRSTFGWSLSNLVALLRQQLFVYRDVWVWLDHPFQAPPPLGTLPEQLVLAI